MPTERFLKLKEAKRNRILEAATEEFINQPYHMVSINKIIEEAGISRGSFYTYFEDKNELFQYIIADFGKTAKIHIIAVLERNGGDIFRAADELILTAMEYQDDSMRYRLYRSIFTDYNILKRLGDYHKKTGEGPIHMKDKRFQEFCRDIYDASLKQKAYMSFDDFALIMDMIIMIAVKSIVTYFNNTELKPELIETFGKQIKFIEHGADGGKFK